MHRPAQAAGDAIHGARALEYAPGTIVIDPEVHGMPTGVIRETERKSQAGSGTHYLLEKHGTKSSKG